MIWIVIEIEVTSMPAKTVKLQYIVSKSGQKKFVVLPVAEYEELIEDLHDLKVKAQRSEEKPVKLNDFEKKLKRDGLL